MIHFQYIVDTIPESDIYCMRISNGSKRKKIMNNERENNESFDSYDEILDKIFDSDKKKTKINEDNAQQVEQLDLFNVDYRNNKDLPIDVKQKPFASTNLLMRFRSQLNRIIWTGLSAAHTKILLLF